MVSAMPGRYMTVTYVSNEDLRDPVSCTHVGKEHSQVIIRRT